MRDLNILYEDNSVIIVNKPAGLAVQGGKNVKISLDVLLAQMRPSEPPLLVHRLDKDTSGVLLAAKTKEAAARYSGYFNNVQSAGKDNPKVEKTYIAVCFGVPKNKQGVITAELEIHGKVKKSRTTYKVIKTATLLQNELSDLTYSVMELDLGTGRMHQIRRHLAMIGCPIIGDDKYGDFKLNKKLKAKRLLLHAHRLVIKDSKIDITAPPPEYFLQY